jgi:hypothetical protein
VAKTYSCTHRYSTGIRTSLFRVQRWNSRLWRATGDGKHLSSNVPLLTGQQVFEVRQSVLESAKTRVSGHVKSVPEFNSGRSAQVTCGAAPSPREAAPQLALDRRVTHRAVSGLIQRTLSKRAKSESFE